MRAAHPCVMLSSHVKSSQRVTHHRAGKPGPLNKRSWQQQRLPAFTEHCQPRREAVGPRGSDRESHHPKVTQLASGRVSAPSSPPTPCGRKPSLEDGGSAGSTKDLHPYPNLAWWFPIWGSLGDPPRLSAAVGGGVFCALLKSLTVTTP